VLTISNPHRYNTTHLLTHVTQATFTTRMLDTESKKDGLLASPTMLATDL
jgi:hypothetical protein